MSEANSSLKPPGKTIARETFIAAMIVAIVAIGGVYVLMYVQMNNQQAAFEANYTSLMSLKNTLEGQKNALQANYNSLLSSYDSLSDQHDALIANYEQLDGEYDVLTGQYWDLYDEYIALTQGSGSLQEQYDTLYFQYQALELAYSSLQDFYDEAQSIINLQKTSAWVSSQTISQPANSYSYWTHSANYAGYLIVNVHSSTTTTTYVRVTYLAYGVSFDQTITVGSGGIARFPVLPSSSIQVRVGNTNLINGATETVSVTYVY